MSTRFSDGKGEVEFRRHGKDFYQVAVIYSSWVIVVADVKPYYIIPYVEKTLSILENVAEANGEEYDVANLRDQVIGHLQTLQNISVGVQ